jgi:ankyrin repeat protein
MGADPNARDNVGWTPLHIAVVQENNEAVRLLVSAGADIHARDVDGITPLEFAERGHPNTLEALLQAQSD